MIRTSNELELVGPENACKSVSGRPKLIAPTSINLGTRVRFALSMTTELPKGIPLHSEPLRSGRDRRPFL